MSNSTEQEFITKKHGKLINIASAANVFAWIALASQILYMGGMFIELQNSYMIQTMTTNFGQNPNFMEMLSEKPLYAFKVIIDLASIFLRGIVYWLALKGISLGLNMIVETDLNYKDKLQEGINE